VCIVFSTSHIGLPTVYIN